MKISDRSRYFITLMDEILQIQRGHKAVLLTDLQLSPNIMENQQII